MIKNLASLAAGRKTIRKFQLALLTTLVFCCCGCSNGKTSSESWEVAPQGVFSAAIGKNGQIAVIGTVFEGGSLWQLDKGERRYNWNHQKATLSDITATAISPNGEFALTADPKTIVLWGTSDGQSLTYCVSPGNILAVALSAKGDYALLGLSDFTAVIFDVKHGGVKKTFYHANRVRSVSLSKDGVYVLTGCEDKTATLWDAKSGKKLFTQQHTNDVQLVALSPDGKIAFSSSKYDRAIFWDTKTGVIIGVIEPLDENRYGMTFTNAEFSADSKQLLTGSTDRSVKLWNVQDQTLIEHWTMPIKEIGRPSWASTVAVGYGEKPNTYFAVSSDGFIHKFEK